MRRCIELAKKGLGNVAPNPLVGAILVCNEKIIGEGYHAAFGDAHAEVNAINNVGNIDLLEKSTLYCNLEPCAHFGKTPPCASLIIEKKIKKVVVGMLDPFERVSGKGIQMMRDAGIEVVCGVLENDCMELNKRFVHHVKNQRPYVILKWAQSIDGFIDSTRSSHKQKATKISGALCQVWVHKQRSIEGAILVGKNTLKLDNPKLNVRKWFGNNPLRISFYEQGINSHYFFDNSQNTALIGSVEIPNWPENIARIDNSDLIGILGEIGKMGINSLIVEGGSTLLNSFIKENLWNEAVVIQSKIALNEGVKAPDFHFMHHKIRKLGEDELLFYKRNNNVEKQV